jgi:hypothetical protein
MIERHAIGATTAAVMTGYAEPVVAESGHHLDLVARDRAH